MKRKDFVGNVCPAIVLAMMSAPLIYSCSREEDAESIVPTPPIIKYTITFNSGEGGSVSTTGGEYEAGQTVSVTANPQGEYVFTSWSDGNTDATRSIVIDATKILTANFEKKKYPLIVNVEGEGEVLEEIVNSGRTTDYDSGTTLKLTAVSSQGWMFEKWKGDLESSDEEVQLLITAPKEVTAVFSVNDVDEQSEQEEEYQETKALINSDGYYVSGKLLSIDLSNENYETLTEISAFVNDMENGILILRKDQTNYMVFDNCCPHLGTRNQWTYGSNRFRCNNHGNSFGTGEGFTSFCSSNSTSGNLKQFPVTLYKDLLTVDFS